MNAKSNSDASKVDVTDTEILTFYNKATSTLLTALEVIKLLLMRNGLNSLQWLAKKLDFLALSSIN